LSIRVRWVVQVW